MSTPETRYVSARPVFPSRRRPTPAIAGVAPLLLLTGAAIILAIAITREQPGFLLAVPAGLAGVIVCARWPAAAVFVVVFISSTIGSLVAFTALVPDQVADIIDYALFGLWLAVAGMYLSGRGKRSPWLWPGLLGCILYVGLTALWLPFTEPISVGQDSFRQSAWHMLALVLVAVAPWSSQTHLRMARGIAVIALAVGAYACYRWVTGQTEAEAAVVGAATESKRFSGTFLSGFQLASWAAFLMPFCLALAVGWRDRWRFTPVAALGALAIALWASHTRAGVVAAAAGMTVTLGLFLLSRAFRGRRATVLIVSLMLATIGIGGLAATVSGSGRQAQRYSRLLTPSADPGLADRTEAWSEALRLMYRKPWGHGLGRVGSVAPASRLGPVGPRHLDNSYLKVGLEQGIVVMLLFVLALILLLLGLARQATVIRDSGRSLLAIAACGTLTVVMVLFILGLYIEGPQLVVAWILVGLGAAQVKPGPRRASPAAG